MAEGEGGEEEGIVTQGTQGTTRRGTPATI